MGGYRANPLMEWRRRLKSDVWHFCGNCSQWPKAPTSYLVRDREPTSGEDCNQCLSKSKREVCK